MNDEDVRRSVCRLHAECMDRRRSEEGRLMMRRSSSLPSLRSSIATLLSAGGKVELVHSDGSSDVVSVTRHLKGECFVVDCDWSFSFLADCMEGDDSRGGAFESAIRLRDAASPSSRFHVYSVSRIICPVVLLPDVNWSWVMKSFAVSVRFHVECFPDRKSTRVLWYKNGLLEKEEDTKTDNRSVSIDVRVDFHSTCSDLPPVSDLPTPDLRAFSRVFLDSSSALLLSASPLLKGFYCFVGKWRGIVRDMWHVASDQDMIDLLRSEEVPDCVSLLVDSRNVLLPTVTYNEDVDSMGMSVLRRMGSSGCGKAAEWRAASVGEHCVVGFKMVPLTRLRFSHLFRIGALDRVSESVCEHGFLVGTDSEREIVLPFDSEPRDATLAIASLLPFTIEETNPPQEEIRLPFVNLMRHAGHGCFYGEATKAYRIRLNEEGVLLTLDKAIGTVKADDSVVSIDSVSSDSVGRCEERASRGCLSSSFQHLSKRIQVSEDPVSACLMEAQSRRCCSEWTLEGIDSGSNLSSLGLSVAVALSLSLWCGAKVRVYVGVTHAALFSYWDVSKSCHQLVDPLRTVLNTFDGASHLIRSYSCEVDFEIKKQTFLEVRQRRTWHACVVLSVDVQTETANVRLLFSGKRISVCLRQHAWRRLARGSDTDVERVIRRCLAAASKKKEAEQEGSNEERETLVCSD